MVGKESLTIRRNGSKVKLRSLLVFPDQLNRLSWLEFGPVKHDGEPIEDVLVVIIETPLWFATQSRTFVCISHVK